MRREVGPVAYALGEWQTTAAINRYLGTSLLPTDLAQWSHDDRALVLALVEKAAEAANPHKGRADGES
jgi:hypothetical protein